MLFHLFVIAMMPLNHILRIYTGSYTFTKLQEKTNHQMYMEDIKLFAKYKRIEDFNTNNKIQVKI